ncbi:SpoIIE family protein phosphatase [Kitasatospora camelliae]|uniref:SpoIIE family protein phosphatase n=1 Tax=Kitasatospora camelliae TaxID=3156397 RepID=A0AAU8K0E7_9ACTN
MAEAEREATDAALLEALFAQSPSGLFVLDTDLRVVRFNRAARGVRDLPEDAVLGRTAEEFAPGIGGPELDALARGVLETGETVRNRVIRGPSPADPERELSVSLSAFRLQAPDGRVLGLAVIAEDVTEREAALRRLAILDEAHRLIGSTLDETATAEELVEVVVGPLADAAVVDLLDPVTRGEQLRPGPVDPATPLRRAAARMLGGGLMEVGGLVQVGFPTPYTQSLTDLRPRLISRLRADDPWLAADPERGRRLLDAGVHSLIVVPLTVQHTVLGLAALLRYRNPQPFEDADLKLASELAARTALSLDKVHAYLRERTVATALQRHLLPRKPPALTAVDAAHLHLSGDRGSDWFDVVPLSGARVALVVGTVAGRGIESAAAMGQLRTAVQTLAGQDLAPDDVLSRLAEAADRAARPSGSTGESGPPRATCLYLVYDPVARRCTAVSAGHPPPLVLGPDGEPVPFEVPVGPGLPEGRVFEQVDVELPAGSLLALYTEGLAEEGPPGGETPVAPDRAHLALHKALAPADRPLRDLCDAAAYALARRSGADATLLLARTHVLGGDQVALWELPDDPSQVSVARRHAREQLARWDLHELTDATELIVSELVTNAVRYGIGPIRLRLIRDSGLICEVSDSNSTAPHMRLAHDTDEGGRGLFLVMRLSRRWGTRYDGRGKTIWSEQPAPPP